MPIGGGNPVSGNNPSGIGQTLNYIGKHVYANSGLVSVAQSTTTLLKFSTASSSYILAGLQFGCINKVSEDFDLEIKIDGQTIMGIQIDNSNQEYFYGMYPIELIIPPSSVVEVTMFNISSDTGRDWFAIMTGEVYA